MHIGGAQVPTVVKEFAGWVGVRCVILNVKVVWILKVYMALTLLYWENMSENVFKNLICWSQEFLRRDISQMCMFWKQINDLRRVLYGQVYGMLKSIWLEAFVGWLAMENPLKQLKIPG